MQKTSLTLRTLAVAAALALTGAAHAKLGAADGATLSPNNPLQPSLNSATTFLDVSGIQSIDGQGSPGNVIRTVQLAPFAEVTGIGWDVNITAFSPSWQSEMRVSFGSTDTIEIFLTVANGVNSAGTASYSSGGIVDLIGLGLDFTVGADGLLVMEFFESFVDFPGAPDGVWNSGTLNFEVSAIPEPGTYGLMALGLLGVAAAARRRKAG